MRRELASLQSADHAERDQAQTTNDMMIHIIERTTRIVELQNKIRALEGADEYPEDSAFDSRIPQSLTIPSKQDPP